MLPALLLLALGAAPPAATPSPEPSPAALVDFALGALEMEPEARIEDVYKWLFQATRGGEHAVRAERDALRWLDAEWPTLGAPRPNEPLLVPLRPDGAVVRLNLRPYRARGGGKAELLAAFVTGARGFDAKPAAFLAAWAELGGILKKGARGRLDRESWERLDAEASRAGYPALHHHPAYEASARPAYRVLTGDLARSLVDALRPPSPPATPAPAGLRPPG